MEDREHYIDLARELSGAGKKEEALMAYSKAFDALIEEAAVYAKHAEHDIEDTDELRAHTPQLIEHSQTFLKQDMTAANILNDMGLLFRDLGDYDNARQKWEEAIALIPSDIVYDESMEQIRANITALPVPVTGDIV